ncbi:proton-dependent oligopeptide transport protein [Tubulinosema ratisbonensis]|uniref:Proton-dependent oligopeptide transport protein n=1 Tax=Tubulinosema ratisbonensis TaxID=291195 RepID=A0A437ANZ4_9MICR|nr:proton-dependent oligopeptide transport protein [Tubulinosema ratisbonensis]
MKDLKNNKKVLSLIILNEFCERYCFYSIRSILFTFLIKSYTLSTERATFLVHSFVFLCYLFGVIGGLIADGFLGRYKTIVYFNFLYFIGNLMILFSSYHVNLFTLIISLTFISMGTGGLKPCISAFGGDQLTSKKEVEGFFSLFYFSINAGSLFGIVLSPILASYNCVNNNCYFTSFKVSTMVHSLSIILFLIGSRNYIKKQPDKQFLIRLWRYLKLKYFFSSKIEEENEEVQIICPDMQKDVQTTIKIFKVFMFVPFFWMLNDQYSSSWIDQGNKMKSTINFFKYEFYLYPSQMAAVNAIGVIFMIPLFVKYVYPFFYRRKCLKNPLEKMYFGLAFTIGSFLISIFIQILIEFNYQINLLSQIPQYLLLTAGEILMSITGLQFAYSQSPESMKSLVFSGWLMTTAIGNFYIMILSVLNPFKILLNASFTLKTLIFSAIVGSVGLCWMMIVCKREFI